MEKKKKKKKKKKPKKNILNFFSNFTKDLFIFKDVYKNDNRSIVFPF